MNATWFRQQINYQLTSHTYYTTHQTIIANKPKKSVPKILTNVVHLSLMGLFGSMSSFGPDINPEVTTGSYTSQWESKHG